MQQHNELITTAELAGWDTRLAAVGSTDHRPDGDAVLDDEAQAIVHRADPFPKFPAAKPQAQDMWTWTMNFDRETRR